MNDFESTSVKALQISLDMPSDLCDLDAEEIECVPHLGYQKQMSNKYALILMNQKRFIQDKYSGDTPIVLESVLKWVAFENKPILHIYNIKEIELTREDSIFMQIDSLTEIEEKAF